jgi:hypothetical protein
MPVTLTEKIDSREWSGGSVTFHYRLTGTSDDVTAKTLLLNSTPSTYQGLVREPDPTLEPEWVDTTRSDGAWNCTIRFSPKEQQQSEIGTVTISGDTKGGTQHITQSLQTIARYPSGTAENFQGAIGVSKSGPDATVEGVDVVVPVFNFTVTKVWAENNLPSLGTIYSLTGKVNSGPFSITDTETGLTISVDTGECLFNGASFGGQRGDGGVEFTYAFSASANRTGITVGGIGGISKKGWEYMWVRYADAEGDSAIIKKPIDVHVEKVYELGNFGSLGL